MKTIPSLDHRLAARIYDGRRPHVMNQAWESLLFLHWECDPQTIAAILPPGLYPDLFEGKAYVGVVPFFMRRIRPLWSPSIPGVSNFLESNVRTYVHDDQGVPGVWFTSLECNQPIAVWIARKRFHLPYVHAAMAAEEREGWIEYRTRRRGVSESASFRYRGYGEIGEAVPGSLEFFLLERYYLYAWEQAAKLLVRGQVVHAPYRYRRADVSAFSTLPACLDGFNLASFPCHQCTAETVSVKIHNVERFAVQEEETVV